LALVWYSTSMGSWKVHHATCKLNWMLNICWLHTCLISVMLVIHMFRTKNKMNVIWHGAYKIWYNIQPAYCMYHGISPASLYLFSTNFHGCLIEYGTESIPDNKPWFSTNIF
jgi:hypothetical protein